MLVKIILLCILACSLSASANEKANPVNNSQCLDCHPSSFADWQQSDHARAMAIADKSSVLADFDNASINHYGQKAVFFKKGDSYQVRISDENGNETLTIKYSFGHYPLQQYLVETSPGRLQVLPFSWDSRPLSEGGQRWYHNYSQEPIKAEDRLHWRQPLQNWNGMCADCHSDGLERRYNAIENRFDSQWDNINVGCLSCHGDMSSHAKNLRQQKASLPEAVKQLQASQWQRKPEEKTASWQGKERDNSFMQGCFSCHSLRAPLTDGFKANKAFLDQFSPQLLSAPMYHADGQIKEEVYVYGSFLQSKMYAAGVNCLDCHDKHSMKLKIQGNGLCLQCHSAEHYNTQGHHRHKEGSEGGQCVNCHMPETRYMGVDDRRDHGFKIPRPDVSIAHGSPNACNKCHQDKSNHWAQAELESWFGPSPPLSQTRRDFMTLHSGTAIGLERHLAIIADKGLDTITRATALQLLAGSTQVIEVKALLPYLNHADPLMRLSAAQAATLLSDGDRIRALTPLLKDKLKAIRVAAAKSLVTTSMAKQDSNLFDHAFNDLLSANEINSWRGEGRANQGVLALEQGDIPAAEHAFSEAIKIDPYFEGAYINLADIFHGQGQPARLARVLQQGMARLPESATIRYAYGLYLVRQQQLNQALVYFEQAMSFAPETEQYAYTYLLALDGQGKTEQAIKKLKDIIGGYARHQQLKSLGLHFSRKLGDPSAFEFFSSIE